MSQLNRLFKSRGNPCWSVIDASPDGLVGVSVRAPQAPGGKPGVASCGAVTNEGVDANSLARLARSIAVADSPWAMSLDRKAYTILVIQEPSVRQEEMEQSVRWAISTLIDFPIAEAAVAHMKIPTAKLLPNRPAHIYVVATRRETVDANRELFRQAKLSLKAIDIKESAHRNIAALVAKPGEGLALLSVSKRGVQLTVTFQGELYLDRHVDETIFGDALDATAKERVIERIVLKVQRTLDFVGRTLPFIDISRLVLAPMPGKSDLRERLAENLPVPVESLDLGQVFDFTRTPDLLREENQANYFVALGTALRFNDETA